MLPRCQYCVTTVTTVFTLCHRCVIVRCVSTVVCSFVRDVKPTGEEFEEALQFLRSMGEFTVDKRSEPGLISAILGVDTLVNVSIHSVV